jgi:hypothetical protein
MTRPTKVYTVLLWLVTGAMALAVIYGLYHASLGPLASQLYTTLARSSWALALAWLW